LLLARLELNLENADIVARALKPDDLPWSRCYSKGSRLIVEVDTEKIGAMLNAIDDYFLNTKAAILALEVLKANG
jgi:hypothetical protein